MSRGRGETQRYILDYLRRTDDGWVELVDVAYARQAFPEEPAEAARRTTTQLRELVGPKVRPSIYESVRRATKRLVSEMAVERRKTLRDRRNWEVRLRPDPHALKQRALDEALDVIREIMRDLSKNDQRRIERLAADGGRVEEALGLIAHYLDLTPQEVRQMIRLRLTERLGGQDQ